MYLKAQIYARVLFVIRRYETPSTDSQTKFAVVFSCVPLRGVGAHRTQFPNWARTRRKQDERDAGFTGRLAREANFNSIDDGLGSLTRASYQRPFETGLRNVVRASEIHANHKRQKKKGLYLRRASSKEKRLKPDFSSNHDAIKGRARSRYSKAFLYIDQFNMMVTN